MEHRILGHGGLGFDIGITIAFVNNGLTLVGHQQLTAGTGEPIAGRIRYAEQGYENAILQSRDLGLEFSSYDFGYSEELGDYIADFTVTLNTPGLHWVDIIFYDAEGNAVTRTACITALQ